MKSSKPTCNKCGSNNMIKGKWYLGFHRDTKFRYYHCQENNILGSCSGVSDMEFVEVTLFDKLLIKINRLK